jgi:hypothetical protein
MLCFMGEVHGTLKQINNKIKGQWSLINIRDIIIIMKTWHIKAEVWVVAERRIHTIAWLRGVKNHWLIKIKQRENRVKVEN